MRRNHPESPIIGDPTDHVQTKSSPRTQGHTIVIFEIEPKHIDDAIQDDNWVQAMQEELYHFQNNDVWKLVELPKGNKFVGAKWVLNKKLDKNGKVVKNKARLVTKGYSQLEGIDYKETYATTTRLEAIRILLSFPTYSNIKLYQMDVKNVFLNGLIQ